MPMTPGCHPWRPSTIAPRSLTPPQASIIAWASSTIVCSTSCRCVLQRSSSSAISPCQRRVVGRQHLDGHHRALEPAGRVDPRGEAEPDDPRREPLLVEAARRPPAAHASPTVGSPAIPASPCRTRTRFSSAERDDVGDGGQRHQADRPDQEIAEVGRGFLAVAEALADLPRQLERHAGAAEVAAGIAAARQPGVDDTSASGKLGPIVW